MVHSFFGGFMNIAVYLGASFGNNKKFQDECVKLGNYIGKSNHTLIYGGSKSGLMGLIADSVLEEGGKVIGIEPKMFIDRALQHPLISELIITDNLAERRQKMLELGDCYIAFPGGTGTLDEITEAMEMISLSEFDSKYKNKKCIFYNLDGYYNEIKSLLDKMILNDFTNNRRLKNVYFANDLKELDIIINS